MKTKNIPTDKWKHKREVMLETYVPTIEGRRELRGFIESSLDQKEQRYKKELSKAQAEALVEAAK